MRLRGIAAAAAVMGAVLAAVCPASAATARNRLVRENGNLCYYDRSGNKAVDRWVTAGTGRYYFGKTGTAYAGTVKKISGHYYGFEANGKAMRAQWAKMNGGYYLFGSDYKACVGWKTYNGKRYYFKANAKRTDGLASIGGKKYFFDGYAGAVRGMREIGGRKYFFGSGYYALNGLVTYEGKLYKMTPSGAATGLMRLSSGIYFFEGDGAAAVGWRTIGDNVYYFKPDFKAATGTRVIGGDEYYFSSSGVMTRNKWRGDKWYGDDGKYVPSAVKNGLRDLIRSKVAKLPGAWSVYVKNLKTGETTEVSSGRRLYAASLIKLYALGTICSMEADGSLAHNQTIETAMTKMITISDNWSFNYLVKLVGKDVVNRWISANGYSGTEVVHGLNPADNSEGIRTSPDGENHTTARDCGKFLEAVYKGKCVNQTYSAKMLNLLKNQTRRTKIPAGVPAGTVVANKTGETDDTSHDAAIVYAPKGDYVIVIMSETNGLGWNQPANIADLSKAVYEYYNK